MKKLVRLTESDFTKLINKVIKETEMDRPDYEMSGTRRRGEFTPTDREKQIQGVFGSYSEDIPPSVIRYMRKNPDKIVKRLYDIYGEKIYDIISDYSQGEMDHPLDEATTKTVKQTEMDKGEWENFMKKGGAVTGTVKQDETGKVTITSESDNPFEDVPMWKGKK